VGLTSEGGLASDIGLRFEFHSKVIYYCTKI
jgi:hypothetical protein